MPGQNGHAAASLCDIFNQAEVISLKGGQSLPGRKRPHNQLLVASAMHAQYTTPGNSNDSEIYPIWGPSDTTSPPPSHTIGFDPSTPRGADRRPR